jgi:hypothetical protein
MLGKQLDLKRFSQQLIRSNHRPIGANQHIGTGESFLELMATPQRTFLVMSGGEISGCSFSWPD